VIELKPRLKVGLVRWVPWPIENCGKTLGARPCPRPAVHGGWLEAAETSHHLPSANARAAVAQPGSSLARNPVGSFMYHTKAPCRRPSRTWLPPSSTGHCSVLIWPLDCPTQAGSTRAGSSDQAPGAKDLRATSWGCRSDEPVAATHHWPRSEGPGRSVRQAPRPPGA